MSRKNALSDWHPAEAMTAAQYLEFAELDNNIETELTDAQETVRSIKKRQKNHRAKGRAAGINIEAHVLAKRDAKRPSAERDAIYSEHRRYLFFMSKPLGHQAALSFEPDDAAVVDVHRLKAIDLDGYQAGKTGGRRADNTWSVGTEEFQRWDAAYLRGQGEREPSAETPRRRGRPPGSRSKPGPDLTVHEGGAVAAAAESDTRH